MTTGRIPEENVGIDDLLKQVAEGNRLAFTRFFNLFYDKVYRFAYCFVQDKDGCREIVTDVFFSVWQSRKKLPTIENIDTYLYVSTRHEAGRFSKKMHDVRFVPLDEVQLQLEDYHSESPENEIETNELVALLGEIVNGLPEKCRQIFLMSREDGLKNKDIAEILSISENTVRVQLKIAVDKIMEQMKPYLSTTKYLLIASILKFF